MQRLKAGLASVVAVALAVASGAHALSSATARKSPELALALWPSNGLARERLAYRTFVESARRAIPEAKDDRPEKPDPDLEAERTGPLGSLDLRPFALAATPDAIRALRDAPLSPKAHVILALSLQDPVRREKIVQLASQLNRRDLPLQGLVLESRVAAGDYAGTIATLDQILRVHPQRQAEFFPILTGALRQRATISAFRNLLSDPVPWRDAFLMHAAADADAARNLADIREATDFGNSEFDKSLIANLARNGDLEVAARLYRKIGNASPTNEFLWSSAYPPFDWTFAQQPGLRAQLSKNDRDLEFAIDQGNGGALASKLIRRPSDRFTVTVRYELTDPSLGKDLKLSLMCNGQSQPFFESSFADQKGRFNIDQNPGCDYLVLAIIGRSWTGGSALNGSITDVLITAR